MALDNKVILSFFSLLIACNLFAVDADVITPSDDSGSQGELDVKIYGPDSIELGTSGQIKVIVTDSDGWPIQGVHVDLKESSGACSFSTDGDWETTISGLTDQNGIFAAFFKCNQIGSAFIDATAWHTVEEYAKYYDEDPLFPGLIPTVLKIYKGRASHHIQVTAPAPPPPTRELHTNFVGDNLLAVLFLILISLGGGTFLWRRNKLQIVPETSSIPADGKSELPIKVQFANTFGKIRTQKLDREIRMETTSGKIEDLVIPAGKAFAEGKLISSLESGPVTVTAKSGSRTSKAQVDFATAETGLDVSVSPAKILADGKSTASITIKVKDGSGNYITSHEERTVDLETNLGTVTSPIKIPPKTLAGTATLTSGQISGTASVTASSGQIKGEAKVDFEELPKRYCMWCGTAVDADKCPKCGKFPPSDVDTKQCSSCNTVLPMRANFCDKCGAAQAKNS